MLRRQSDEQDSTNALWLNYTQAILVTAGVFITDWVFEKGILDGALIGVMLSKVFDAISKQNEYFFPNERGPKQPRDDRANDEKKGA